MTLPTLPRPSHRSGAVTSTPPPPRLAEWEAQALRGQSPGRWSQGPRGLRQVSAPSPHTRQTQTVQWGGDQFAEFLVAGCCPRKRDQPAEMDVGLCWTGGARGRASGEVRAGRGALLPSGGSITVREGGTPWPEGGPLAQCGHTQGPPWDSGRAEPPLPPTWEHQAGRTGGGGVTDSSVKVPNIPIYKIGPRGHCGGCRGPWPREPESPCSRLARVPGALPPLCLQGSPTGKKTLV